MLVGVNNCFRVSIYDARLLLARGRISFVREVAELRAMCLVIGPVDQLFIALSYLLLPMLALHYASRRMDKLVYLWGKYFTGDRQRRFVVRSRCEGHGEAGHASPLCGKIRWSWPLLSLLALLPLLMGIGNTLSNVLNAMEKPKLVFWVTCAAESQLSFWEFHWCCILACAVQFTECLYLAALYGRFGGCLPICRSQECSTGSHARTAVACLARGVWAAPGSESSSLRHGKHPTQIAPIALFVYNRPNTPNRP